MTEVHLETLVVRFMCDNTDVLTCIGGNMPVFMLGQPQLKRQDPGGHWPRPLYPGGLAVSLARALAQKAARLTRLAPLPG